MRISGSFEYVQAYYSVWHDCCPLANLYPPYWHCLPAHMQNLDRTELQVYISVIRWWAAWEQLARPLIGLTQTNPDILLDSDFPL